MASRRGLWSRKHSSTIMPIRDTLPSTRLAYHLFGQLAVVGKQCSSSAVCVCCVCVCCVCVCCVCVLCVCCFSRFQSRCCGTIPQEKMKLHSCTSTWVH